MSSEKVIIIIMISELNIQYFVDCGTEIDTTTQTWFGHGHLKPKLYNIHLLVGHDSFFTQGMSLYRVHDHVVFSQQFFGQKVWVGLALQPALHSALSVGGWEGIRSNSVPHF